MEFSRQEYWNGLPFSSSEDLPDQRIEPGSPALQADLYHLSRQGNPLIFYIYGKSSYCSRHLSNFAGRLM